MHQLVLQSEESSQAPAHPLLARQTPLMQVPPPQQLPLDEQLEIQSPLEHRFLVEVLPQLVEPPPLLQLPLPLQYFAETAVQPLQYFPLHWTFVDAGVLLQPDDVFASQ